MTTADNERARRLRSAVEPQADGIARPEMKSYVTSRSACLARVSGEVVAGPHFGSGLTIDTAAVQNTAKD